MAGGRNLLGTRRWRGLVGLSPHRVFLPRDRSLVRDRAPLNIGEAAFLPRLRPGIPGRRIAL